MIDQKAIAKIALSSIMALQTADLAFAGAPIQKSATSLKGLSQLLQKTQAELSTPEKDPIALNRLAVQSRAMADDWDLSNQDDLPSLPAQGSLISTFELPASFSVGGLTYSCPDIQGRMSIVRQNLVVAAKIARRATQLAEYFTQYPQHNIQQQVPDQRQSSSVNFRRLDRLPQQSQHAQSDFAQDITDPEEILNIAMKEVDRLEEENETHYPAHLDEKVITATHTWSSRDIRPYLSPESTGEIKNFEPLSIAIHGYTWQAGSGSFEHISDFKLSFDPQKVQVRRSFSLVEACAGDLSLVIEAEFISPPLESRVQKLTLVGTVN